MGPGSHEADGYELPPDLAEALRALRTRDACPEPALLQAAEAEVLPAETAVAVSQHIQSCPICRSLARDLSTLDDHSVQNEELERIWARVRAASVGLQRPILAPRWPRRWGFLLKPWPLAVAIAACIVLMITLGLLRSRPQPVSGIRPPTAPASERPSTPPAMASVIEKPPVLLPPEAVLVWRNGDTGDQTKWKELQEALAPYQSSDYAIAAQHLKQVASRHPGLAEAWFYLGVSELMANDYGRAAADLETARKLSQPTLQDYPSWCLAKLYQRLERGAESREILQEICSGTGIHRAAACLELKRGTDGGGAAAAPEAPLKSQPHTTEQQARFGDTGAGESRLRRGMTFAEVEAVFGAPRTRVELGEKLLYKYVGMTVVFRDGKVTDVQ